MLHLDHLDHKEEREWKSGGNQQYGAYDNEMSTDPLPLLTGCNEWMVAQLCHAVIILLTYLVLTNIILILGHHETQLTLQ